MSDREIKCPVCKCIMTEPEEWPRPIPVSERLPNIDDLITRDCNGEAQSDDVMVYSDCGEWSIGWFNHAKQQFFRPRCKYDEHSTDAPVWIEGATHWLPLPPEPE